MTLAEAAVAALRGRGPFPPRSTRQALVNFVGAKGDGSESKKDGRNHGRQRVARVGVHLPFGEETIRKGTIKGQSRPPARSFCVPRCAMRRLADVCPRPGVSTSTGALPVRVRAPILLDGLVWKDMRAYPYIEKILVQS